MNRRDTIIIAVLLNAGILAILFLLAIHDNEEVRYPEPLPAVVQSMAPQAKDSDFVAAVQAPLEDFVEMSVEETNSSEDESPYPTDAYTFSADQKKNEAAGKAQSEPEKASPENFVAITVKRGDSLDKLARNNGTSIEEIKKLNQLKSDMLNIGQILRMPKASKALVAQKPIEKKNSPQELSDSSAFYTLKSGDSPWKIARQHRMNLDDLLRLNHLDEEKARNLKVGDKIRIK